MDFLSTAFSTALGAATALAAERLSRRRDAKLKQEAALNNLILDLAAKRAFLAAGDWEWAEGEVKRVVSSVEHTRSLIRDARQALTPRSWALDHLRQMTRACNTFMEASEREDDERLKLALLDLAEAISRQVSLLHTKSRGRIYGDLPGSFALGERA